MVRKTPLNGMWKSEPQSRGFHCELFRGDWGVTSPLVPGSCRAVQLLPVQNVQLSFICLVSFGCCFPVNPLQWALKMLNQDWRGLSKTGHGVKEQNELTEQVPLRLEVTAYGDQSSALPATSMPGRKEVGTGTLRILSSTLSFKKQVITNHPWMPLHFLFLQTICRTVLPGNTARVWCGRSITGKGADQHWVLARW